MEFAAIVLAGGKSIRLGRSKALEVTDGKSLIERVIGRLKQLSSHILIVTSQEQVDLPVSDEVKILVDILPGKGPLGGIYTGLLASQSLHNIVVACDMPFLNTELLRYMIGLSSDFDVVVPRLSRGKVQPLHAIYSRTCIDIIRAQLERDQLEVESFFDEVRVRYVEQVECQKLDPQLLSFFNVNYQSDLDRAISLATEPRC